MRITQVTPGIISIPPNGWGAVEKIIWEYSNNFKKNGHQCDIKYLNEVEDSDIVHIHVANLAIEAKKRGIRYIFSLHDHHVFRYGKNSDVYLQNLEAIKGSIISFCHAEFLVDYFDSTDKIFYLSHGVNTDLYTPKAKNLPENHRLLCVANNGFIDDPGFDRKGFRYSIESSMNLNLPITVVGPENNMRFFEANTDLLEYENLNLVLNNPSEDELLRIYREHTIFLHPSSLEAGHPNLTVLEALSCGLPVVGTYSGTKKLNGMEVCELNTASVTSGISNVISNYPSFVEKCNLDRKNLDWSIE